MRALAVAAILLTSLFVVASTADAARRSKRSAAPPYHFVPPRYDYREQVECERARNEDPAGKYAGYPCWAREIFGRGDSNGHGP
jgi:hypothetical protein